MVLYLSFCRIVSDRRHIFIDRRQRAGVRGHLHGQRLAAYRQPISGVVGHRRPVRRRVSHDIRAGQRLAGPLDVRPEVL